MPNDNILLITTSRQRFDTLQALGNDNLFTPNLNALMSRGVTFTRCYADCPDTIPAHATLMTGLAGYESGVVGPAGARPLMESILAARATLPAVLTDNGYQTRAVGHMALPPARACYGFEHIEPEADGPPQATAPATGSMAPAPQGAAPEDTPTGWTAARAARFLKTRDPLRPFLLWASFSKPAPPLAPCRDQWLLYGTETMPAPVTGNWSETLQSTPQGFLAEGYEGGGMHHFGPRQLKAAKRAYYALVTQVDAAIGRLMQALAEEKLLDNTWLVFTADGGEMLGDHHLAGGRLFFEGACHVPLIIVPPSGRAAGRNKRVDTLVQLSDLYPTLLDMAGLHLPESGEHTGTSLLQQPADRVFHGNAGGRQFAVICDKIKLVYTTVGGSALLFNLEDDPAERVNLAADEAWRPVYEDMWQMLVAHLGKTAPELFAPDGNFITTAAPAGPQDVTGRGWAEE